MFAGTLRENVNLTRPDAADHEIENALRAVGAWDWAQRIGIDTRVGAGGVDLSPAQAQQVSLSRVVLTDPAVVVLDEATAMLDPRAARDLERSLAALITGRTVVVIAHRLDTARRADRVAVLLNGRIVELGHHDALVETDGPYAALWRAWSAGPARDDPSPAPRPSRQRGGPTDVRLDGPGS